MKRKPHPQSPTAQAPDPLPETGCTSARTSARTSAPVSAAGSVSDSVPGSDSGLVSASLPGSDSDDSVFDSVLDSDSRPFTARTSARTSASGSVSGSVSGSALDSISDSDPRPVIPSRFWNLSWVRIFGKVTGCLCVGLGILGIFLPLLPTTPFLLLASFLFLRTSPALHRRLMAHKRLGPYIRHFQEHKAIPLHVKIVAISTLWLTILISAFCLVPLLPVRILLLVLAAVVTLHILRYKTLR